MEEADIQLLARYRDGDVEALEQLVDRYRRPLFGYLMGAVREAHEAEEIFQEVWVRVMRNADKYREKNFLGWLIRIARNLAIDRSRRRKPDVSLDAVEEGSRPMAETVAGSDANPRERLQDRHLGTRIAEAVARLPAEQKEVFLLRAQSDLPFREIAKIQGTSINTALARMQYALAKLRTALEPEYEELAPAR